MLVVNYEVAKYHRLGGWERKEEKHDEKKKVRNVTLRVQDPEVLKKHGWTRLTRFDWLVRMTS